MKRSASTSTSSPAGPLLSILLWLAAGCTEKGPPERPPPPPADYLPAAVQAPPRLPDVTFVDVTEAAGIRFLHQNGSFGKKFLPETMGSGVALLDYDGDGLLDVFLVNGMRWPGHEKDYPAPAPPAAPALYRNLGGMRFEDVTTRAGVGLAVMGMGAAAADVDGDGDQDLFVTAVGRNLFFRNQGGRFTEEAERIGLSAATWTDLEGRRHGSWGTGAAFLDYDLDGHVDLYVANYVRWSEETDIFTTLDGTTKAFTTPELYQGDSGRLYRNTGSRFEDVTEKAGVFLPDGKSLGVAVEDLDDDGWPDVIVSNDTQPNFLFLNQRNGTFKEMANFAGIAYSPDGRARAGMGIDAVRDRNSSALCIAIGNFSREPISLYRETGNERGVFKDEAGPAGVASPTYLHLTFGLLFLDYDLDSRSDLCLVNGHIEPTIEEVQKGISYAEPAQLFTNLGDGRYGEASRSAGEFFTRRIVGRGLAAGDLDGDGDLDLVFTQNGGPASLLRCDSRTGNRSVRLRLRTQGTNPDALGARVRVAARGVTQSRRVRTGSSYLSQSELVLTFGLGTCPAAEEVEVTWPDRKQETFRDVAAGHTYLVVQGAGKLVPQSAAAPGGAPPIR